MKKQVILTVAESKRLIAKGVAALPEVQGAMEAGMVVVATGTTNAYILQELKGEKFDLRRYRSGITTPQIPRSPPRNRASPSPTPSSRKARSPKSTTASMLSR